MGASRGLQDPQGKSGLEHPRSARSTTGHEHGRGGAGPVGMNLSPGMGWVPFSGGRGPAGEGAERGGWA